MSSSNESTHPEFGFALPPPEFKSAEQMKEFEEWFRDRKGFGVLSSSGVPEQSIEDEIGRKITDLEKVRGTPVSEDERERIATKTRRLREGGWLEGVKSFLVGERTVPIEYFNRLAAEYEGTIPYVVGKLAEADLRVTAKDGEINELKKQLKNQNSDETNGERTKGLEEKLKDCQNHVRDLEREIQDLKTQKQTIEAKDKPENVALKECNRRVQALQRQLNAANADLERTKTDLSTVRQTASNHYNNSQRLEDELRKSRERENQLKDQIRDMQRQLDASDDALRKATAGDANTTGSIEQIANLNIENDRLTARVAELEAKPDQQQDARPDDSNLAQFQQEIADLRQQRDNYREKWARNMTDGKDNLRDFYNAVESRLQDCNDLSRRVGTLCDALGVEPGPNPVRTVDNIIKNIKEMPKAGTSTQIELMTLRNANNMAQLDIQMLRNELAAEKVAKSDNEIKLQLGIVDDEEVEKRVTARTQYYREFRSQLMAHIFDCRNAVINMAVNHPDAAPEMNELVRTYLDPTSLPAPELRPNDG
ncbi:hypothetical protein F5Y18DRAFT_435018 [Xylariaceae sp. FL1019]|nr:hypothetical protein F5Y18DRAFT_435018 [Xylariaceae sp. FL1019]